MMLPDDFVHVLYSENPSTARITIKFCGRNFIHCKMRTQVHVFPPQLCGLVVGGWWLVVCFCCSFAAGLGMLESSGLGPSFVAEQLKLCKRSIHSLQCMEALAGGEAPAYTDEDDVDPAGASALHKMLEAAALALWGTVWTTLRKGQLVTLDSLYTFIEVSQVEFPRLRALFVGSHKGRGDEEGGAQENRKNPLERVE